MNNADLHNLPALGEGVTVEFKRSGTSNLGRELRDREHFRKNYLQPAIRSGFVNITNSEKPRSADQRYLLTSEGLAVLASVATIEPDKSGILIPVKNSLALADAIQRLSEDPDLCQRMGQAGRALAERKFAIEKIVDSHLKIYKELEEAER